MINDYWQLDTRVGSMIYYTYYTLPYVNVAHKSSGVNLSHWITLSQA